MARPCSICSHSERLEIDRLLLGGEPYRNIAERFKLSIGSISRHRDAHIAADLIKSHEIQEATRADSLLQKTEEEAAFVREMRDCAKAEGDIELALKAVDRALKCIELYAKVQGLIQDQPQINITLKAEWIELRTLIVKALEPYPEAKQAVVDALP